MAHYPEFMTLPPDGVGATIKRLIVERFDAEAAGTPLATGAASR
jgi:hypothetical protein